jgi:hypothetical protein
VMVRAASVSSLCCSNGSCNSTVWTTRVTPLIVERVDNSISRDCCLLLVVYTLRVSHSILSLAADCCLLPVACRVALAAYGRSLSPSLCVLRILPASSADERSSRLLLLYCTLSTLSAHQGCLLLIKEARQHTALACRCSQESTTHRATISEDALCGSETNHHADSQLHGRN